MESTPRALLYVLVLVFVLVLVLVLVVVLVLVPVFCRSVNRERTSRQVVTRELACSFARATA